jgi:hypothetical protein
LHGCIVTPLIKRLDAEIDVEADDKAALSHEARERQTAEVLSDLIAVDVTKVSLCSPHGREVCRLNTAPIVNRSRSWG